MVYKVADTTITGIANAIRTMTNSDEPLAVEEFEGAILSIETGEDTASAAQSAKEALAYKISAKTSAQEAAESAGAVWEGVQAAHAWATGQIYELDKDTGEIIGNKDVVDGDPGFQDSAKWHADRAAAEAVKAKDEAVKTADEIRTEMQGYQDAAEQAVKDAQSAVAEIDTDVAAAEKAVTDAQGFANEAKTVVDVFTGRESEAWAVGTKTTNTYETDAEGNIVLDENGNPTIIESTITPVAEGEPQYHNNSKYWSDVARATVEDASYSVATANVFATATISEVPTT